MFTILKLIQVEAKMFIRNRQALFFTLFMPLFIMLIFGYIGFDKPQKIDVGLVVHTPNEETLQFVEAVREFPTFSVHENTLEAERSELDEGNRAAVIDVQDDLLSAGQREPKDLTVYTNASKAGEAQAVVSILNQAIYQMTLEASGQQPIVAVVPEEVNAHDLRYIEFLLPGLIALSIMQMAVFSVAFVFTQYKEKGVLKRLLATPMRPIHFVLSNAIVRLIVSVVQAAIFIVIGLVLFKVQVVGSFFLLALAVILGAFMFLGLGFTISGLAKTTDTVPVFANLIVFPMMFLGGTFFAVENMPGWLQVVANVLPLTYFSDAVREIMTKGTGLAGIGGDLIGMIVWSVILYILATFTFRMQEQDST
ncbi:MAG: ABC transporter permease [Candidatus Pacebacteria bacterium]|nr:ABC transporter permease [Candidatus Paceibacterota bacterium]